MKKILDYATDFMKQSDWRDLTVLKICVFMIGVLCGIGVRENTRKPVVIIGIPVVIATYSYLVAKLLKVVGILPLKKHALLHRAIDEDDI